MNHKFKYFYICLLIFTVACSEPSQSLRPKSILPDNRPVSAGFLEQQPETEKPQTNFYELAAWSTWYKGRTLSAENFPDPNLIQADELSEQLKFDQAQKTLIAVKTENYAQEESLAVRKASLQLLTAKPADAILTLSRFYQKNKISEEQVSAEASLLFGYAYGQARNYEQSLAWFAQASQSRGALIRNKLNSALKLLLPTVPNPILEQSSFTWRANPEISRLISEERFLRQQRNIQSLPEGVFFWMPTYKTESVSLSDSNETKLNFTQPAAKKLAALLPLSGKFSKMGNAIKNGLELAVQHSQASGQPIEIIFADTDSPEAIANLAAVISDLVKAGAQALIGPLVSERAQEVEQIARSNSIPAILLSKGGSATLGEGVYRFGLTNHSQAESLVEALAAQRSNLRLALLYPDDEFGLGFSAALKEELSKKNITPVYDLSYAKGNQSQMNEKAKEFSFSPPEIIIFADNIKASAQFMSELNAQLKKSIIPVGSAAWDNPLELIQSKSSLSRAVFVSAFYPDLQNPGISQFVNDFKTRFSKAPDFFAAQGYDLALILSQSDFSSEKINFPATYAGITGICEAKSYGEIDRKLRVLQLNKGTIQPFSALPAERTVNSESLEVSLSDSVAKQFNDPVVSE